MTRSQTPGALAPLTSSRGLARLGSNNARQGYDGFRTVTLKSAGYFFLGSA